MAERRALVLINGQKQQLPAEDTLVGTSSGGGFEVGPLNIKSGLDVGAAAGTNNVLEWLFTFVNAATGLPLDPEGGLIPTGPSVLFTPSFDVIVTVGYIGNRTANNVSGFALTLDGIWIPGPTTIVAGGSLLLTNYGWVPKNELGGSL